MIITPDPWLSEFFGRPIIQAKVSATDGERSAALQRQGFHFVEGEVTFILPFANFPQKMTACRTIDTAETADITELEEIFGSAFVHSRFRAPWFSAEENQRFYRTWIRHAVHGEFDDLCLISRADNGRVQGGISLRLNGGPVKVGLLAVDSAFRRQGVAKRLLWAAVVWGRQQGAESLEITTQIGNLEAINTYQKLGARIVDTAYWFYFEQIGGETENN